MKWWLIGKKVIFRPINVVAGILIDILWAIVISSRFIIDYEIYDYQQTFIIPISLIGGITFLYIFMLILEIRRLGAERHIKTAEEVYLEKYGSDEKVEDDPLTIKISNTIRNLGATIIDVTRGAFPKFVFSFPIDHKFDTYQRLSLVVERENIYQINAELKYEFPAYLNIRKKEIMELEERMFSTKKLFSQTYMVSSDDPEFANKILEETMIDEVVSEKEAHIDQISVHGNNFTATLSNYESLELLFILLSTIMETYTR
jgi:hypothetical protein